MPPEGYVPRRERDAKEHQYDAQRYMKMFADIQQAHEDGEAADRLFRECGYRGLAGDS